MATVSDREHRSARGEPRRNLQRPTEPQLPKSGGEHGGPQEQGGYRIRDVSQWSSSDWFSGAVAIATLAGVVIAAFQWSTIKAQTQIAADSIRLARENAESAQRAWSLVENIRSVRVFEPGRSNLFEVVTQNYGHSPARGGISCVASILPVGQRPPNVDDQRATAIIINHH